jgi:hypothetical protein
MCFPSPRHGKAPRQVHGVRAGALVDKVLKELLVDLFAKRKGQLCQ